MALITLNSRLFPLVYAGKVDLFSRRLSSTIDLQRSRKRFGPKACEIIEMKNSSLWKWDGGLRDSRLKLYNHLRTHFPSEIEHKLSLHVKGC